MLKPAFFSTKSTLIYWLRSHLADYIYGYLRNPRTETTSDSLSAWWCDLWTQPWASVWHTVVKQLNDMLIFSFTWSSPLHWKSGPRALVNYETIISRRRQFKFNQKTISIDRCCCGCRNAKVRAAKGLETARNFVVVDKPAGAERSNAKENTFRWSLIKNIHEAGDEAEKKHNKLRPRSETTTNPDKETDEFQTFHRPSSNFAVRKVAGRVVGNRDRKCKRLQFHWFSVGRRRWPLLEADHVTERW